MHSPAVFTKLKEAVSSKKPSKQHGPFMTAAATADAEEEGTMPLLAPSATTAAHITLNTTISSSLTTAYYLSRTSKKEAGGFRGRPITPEGYQRLPSDDGEDEDEDPSASGQPDASGAASGEKQGKRQRLLAM